MKAAHVYDKATGLFSGRQYRGKTPEASLALAEANLQPGEAVIVAQIGSLASRRVDVATGEIIPHKPSPPGPDFIWDEKIEQWLPDPAVMRAQRAAQEAQSAIDEREAGSLRAMRELLLSPDVKGLFKRPEDLANLQRLQGSEDAIAAARPRLAVKP